MTSNVPLPQLGTAFAPDHSHAYILGTFSPSSSNPPEHVKAGDKEALRAGDRKFFHSCAWIVFSAYTVIMAQKKFHSRILWRWRTHSATDSTPSGRKTHRPLLDNLPSVVSPIFPVIWNNAPQGWTRTTITAVFVCRIKDNGWALSSSSGSQCKAMEPESA